MNLPPFSTALAVFSLTVSSLFAQTTRPLQAPRAILATYGVADATLQDVPLQSARRGIGYTARIELAGRNHQVVLTPIELRDTGFRVMVDDGRGPRDVTLPFVVESHRGRLDGVPGSTVAGTVREDALFSALVFVDANETWCVQRLDAQERIRHGRSHLVFRVDDVLAQGGFCGTPDLLPAGSAGAEGPGNPKVAQIAIDVDYDFYRRNGNRVEQCIARVFEVLNGVDAIYRRDVDIAFSVTTIIVRTAPLYTWNDDMGDLLTQFRSHWRSNHRSIQRDLAHLFTGKGDFIGVIGIAWLNAVCTSNQYGVSKAYSLNSVSNTGLVAHEIGHNFGSGHCSGSSCNIMCAGLGGCSGVLTSFGPFAINAILSYKNSISCLSDPVLPTLTGTQPSSVSAILGDEVRVQGRDLVGVHTVTLDGQPIPSFREYSSGELRFDPPEASSLGRRQLTVTNYLGTSNAVDLTFVETVPPRHDATEILAANVPQFDLRWGGSVGAVYGMALTLNDAFTIPFAGFDVLANGYVLFGGVLSGTGTGHLSVPYTVRAPGNQLRTQLWTLDPSTLQFQASAVALTWMF